MFKHLHSRPSKRSIIWQTVAKGKSILAFPTLLITGLPLLRKFMLSTNMITRLWLQEDIVPYAIRRQDAAHQLTLEDLVKDVVSRFDENNIVCPALSATHEVQVAELVTLEDYRKTASQEDFALLQELAHAFQGKKLVFINATPRGGGVALMRHALIRLLR